MSVRRTSVETYRKIEADGLLSHRRLQVYQYVFEHGPCSARQCHVALARHGSNSSSFISRFSELREIGVLAEVGETVDPETEQRVILWDVTENLPASFKRIPKPSRKDLERRVAELEAELAAFHARPQMGLWR